MPSTPICLHANRHPTSGLFRPDGVIYCYRTLEHIKHFITSPDTTGRKKWKKVTRAQVDAKKKNNKKMIMLWNRPGRNVRHRGKGAWYRAGGSCGASETSSLNAARCES